MTIPNTIKETHEKIKSGELSIRTLIDSFLKNIEEKNSSINAYIEVYSDIDEQIKNADKMFEEGNETLMTGIPVALKDNMLFLDHKVSSGSKILENYKATYNSTVVDLLKNAGAIFIGRTNMDEFAMGSSTETSFYGITKNPLNEEMVPGGSSGGAVASLAMGGTFLSLGSDTGGSIRQPAAFCGLVGMKPTYGTVSRFGLMAMASSLDQIGPITKNVTDAEILFNFINKYDKNDATSIKEDLRVETKKEVKKIGVPKSWVTGDGIETSVKENFDKSIEVLKSLGYEIIDIDLPLSPYALAVYYILMPAEASSNLSRYDSIRFGMSLPSNNLKEQYEKTRELGFGKEVKRRILLGTYILSHGYYDAYYGKALALQKAIQKEYKDIFEKVDVIATPTSPFLAFPIGAKSNDPIAMKLSDLFTVPANIAGIPAISIPSGDAPNNLKHSLQFMGPNFGENLLFEVAKKFEENVQ